MPFKHLLVGVDGSKPASEAARVALDLAASLGAQVTVVSILDDRIYNPPSAEAPPLPAVESRMQATAEQAVAAVLEQARGLGVVCTTHVLTGDVTPTILQLKEERQADLIVVGTHQRRGLRRLKLGSTAGAISREAACPVLIVHSEEE